MREFRRHGRIAIIAVASLFATAAPSAAFGLGGFGAFLGNVHLTLPADQPEVPALQAAGRLPLPVDVRQLPPVDGASVAAAQNGASTSSDSDQVKATPAGFGTIVDDVGDLGAKA
ncbi:MAG: hypothetical protein KGJ78_07485 [Alphaproteobacteria bacterium]|nr:hypothetical protein [Alphaproteobacteria bacterium]